MALGAVLATALTDRAARTKGLYLAGLDVIKQPGNVTNPYGVPLESVEVVESGPNGVSSMTFTIDDPAIAIVLSEGMDVRYQNITSNVPIFVGWVQSWTYTPDFGQQGRSIAVTCIGPEAILDWSVIPSLTIPAGTTVSAAVQIAASQAVGTGPLRAFGESAGSTQEVPIGLMSTVSTRALTLTGVSLRSAIEQISGVGFSDLNRIMCTVDMYYGLRLWTSGYPGTIFIPATYATPTDWTQIVVSDDIAGPLWATDLNHETNAADIIRGVYITGGNAAGTGLVSDGTGQYGPIATISDTTITTATDLAQAGAAYLQAFALGYRGSYVLDDHTPVYTRHAGTWTQINDPRVGLNVGVFLVWSITKTFHAVRETWTVQYGGHAPSAVKSLRRLTRTLD